MRKTAALLVLFLLAILQLGCSRSDEEIDTTIEHRAYADSTTILVHVSEYVKTALILGPDRRSDIDNATVLVNGIELTHEGWRGKYTSDDLDLSPGDELKMKVTFGGHTYWYDGAFPDLTIIDFSYETYPYAASWIPITFDNGLIDGTLELQVFADQNCTDKRLDVDIYSPYMLNLPDGLVEHGAMLQYTYRHRLSAHGEYQQPIITCVQRHWFPPNPD